MRFDGTDIEILRIDLNVTEINFKLHELGKECLEYIFKIISSRRNIICVYCERV
jgi:hypothetical protein